MPVKSPEAKVEIKDEWQRKFNYIQEQATLRNTEIQNSITKYYEKGGKDKGFRFNPNKMRAEILSDIAKEKDSNLKYLIMMNYMRIPYSEVPDANSRRLAAELLGKVPANSPLWFNKSSAVRAIVMTGAPDKYDKFLTDLSQADEDTSIVPWSIYSEMRQSDFFGGKDDIMQMYALLKRHFANSKALATAKKQFDPDKTIEIGKRLPEFSFISVNNPEKRITNADIKGKYALIDLWAVWCGPCRAEMPYLHKVYDKFKSSDFEILSISFDKDINTVAKFRDDKWKMPWLQAFSEGVFNSKASEIFEVIGIPKPMLVSPTGVILAIDGDLRGNNLENTLSKYLGK